MTKFEEVMARVKELRGTQKIPTPEERERHYCEVANSNVGNLNETDGYNCDKCKNKGFIYFLKYNEFSQRNEATVRPCECMSTRETLRRAKASGLGNILTDYTFPKYIANEDWQKEIKQKAEGFCKDENARWFYIGGQSGAGKTHICTAIAGYYIKQRKNCRYMLWRDDAVKLKQLIREYEEYQKVINDFKRADVLYIDDLFKSQSGTEPTTADINLAFELLNNRIMDKSKITIISSEFTIDEALSFDEATIGRVFQATGDYKISIGKDKSKNYRLKE